MSLAVDYFNFLRRYSPGHPFLLDLLPHIEDLTFPRFSRYLKTELFAQADVKALVVGNMARVEAVEMVTEAVEKLQEGFGFAPLSPAEVPERRGMKLPTGWGHEYRIDSPNPAEQNSASLVAF